MAAGMAELRDAENFLKNKGIAISCSNAWLRSCVDCFRTQCNGYRIKELLDFVFEQWLLADLREVGSCSLPKECSSLEKFTVVGKHAVQLNYCVDIGTSSYSQLQKIRRPDFGDNLLSEPERTGELPFSQKNIERRSLKLEISDGQLTVIGFEDKPISCLKNPVPGEKAILKGPIECRKGVLMLTDRNIEILGGEVDTILIPNAVENVLARKLGQPEDPNPYRQRIEAETPREGKMLTDCLDEDNEALLLLAESMEMSQPANQQEAPLINSGMKLSSVSYSTVIDNFDDDFDLIAAQTASLAEAEVFSNTRQDPSVKDELKQEPQSYCSSTTNVAGRSTQSEELAAGTTSTNSPDRVEYVDMNDPKRLKKELEESYGFGAAYYKGQLDRHPAQQSQGSRSYSSPKQSSQITSPQFKLPLNTPEGEIRKLKHEVNFTLSSKNSVTEKVSPKQAPKTTSSHSSCSLQEIDPPVWPRQNKQRSLHQLVNDSEESPSWLSQETDLDSEVSESEPISDNSETFYQPYPPRKFPSLRVVRGQVVRLSEKLTLKNDQWCLSAIVCAKGLEIEMSFASEVLDKIFGVTAAELIARKNDLKTNLAAKEQMNRLLRDSQLRIKNLNCEMVIRFSSVIAKPVIIDVMQT